MNLNHLAEKLIKDIDFQIGIIVNHEYKERLNLILKELELITGKSFDQTVIHDLTQKKKGRPPIIKKKPHLVLKSKID